jgi:flagellar biosynthesis/type III secretory pathway chaperone
MNPDWKPTIEALRAELTEYAALHTLFEQQQQNLLHRDVDSVLGHIALIEAQTQRTHFARDVREAAQRAYAIACNESPEKTLRQLLPTYAEEIRPLVKALIDEINLLVHRLRRDARQNQTLLARAVNVHEEALRAVMPESFNQTYTARGQRTPFTAAAFQATG